MVREQSQDARTRDEAQRKHTSDTEIVSHSWSDVLPGFFLEKKLHQAPAADLSGTWHTSDVSTSYVTTSYGGRTNISNCHTRHTRKKCVLAGGPCFVPAHPFYQKSRPWSCQQCLGESHPTILWIWERGLTTDVAFPAPRTIHRKAWHTLGKLLSVDAVSFPDSILCKLRIGKWSKQICPWSFLMHREMGPPRYRDADLPIGTGAAETATPPALLPSPSEQSLRAWGDGPLGCPAAGDPWSHADLGWLQVGWELSLAAVGTHHLTSPAPALKAPPSSVPLEPQGSHPQEGDEFLRCQEEMALYPVSRPERGPWCLGCHVAEQMAVSWVCFWWRKDGDETAHPLMLAALESLGQLFQGRC
ncbi:uncharacterized protein [Tursiops truncatus]|uniref:uncharacterized protein n=1 Tax=Tursiops truncatus TaxID=9739 RepID=UPI003CCF665C